MLASLRHALVAGALLCSASPAFCSTIDLGLLQAPGTGAFYDIGVSGRFDDIITFTTNETDNLAASVTSSFASAAQYAEDFTIALYRVSMNPAMPVRILIPYAPHLLASATNNVANVPPDSVGAKLKLFDLEAGQFALEVSGRVATATSYSGTIAVSAVPLPASAPLFGAALAVLAAAGGFWRKRSVAATRA